MGPESGIEKHFSSTFHMLPDRAQAAANRRHGDAGSNDERFGRATPTIGMRPALPHAKSRQIPRALRLQSSPVNLARRDSVCRGLRPFSWRVSASSRLLLKAHRETDTWPSQVDL